MSQDAANSINMLTSFGKGPQKNMSIKAGELSVHVPSILEARGLQNNQSFEGVLKAYMGGVNEKQHGADHMIERMVAGDVENLHEVSIAMEEAETSFEMMMEIRNKLMGAYDELKRM
jgi:flagellar hook-basal body complex protein FliE